MIRVTIWNEGRHEQTNPIVKQKYPKGIHGCIADFLKSDKLSITTATLDEPEQGLPDALLESTDVLLWWGHAAHREVSDELVERIAQRVLRGMGLIVLHSGHNSKIFKKLMGTSCSLRWRDDDRERLWCINPSHPIADGVPPYFEFQDEMYGEFFDIPKPDDIIFTGWFSGGEVFRSGCTFTRGLGKIFYFQPGHETNDSYHNPHIRKIIQNAVCWAAPHTWREELLCSHIPVSPEAEYSARYKE